jgi:hypothetical protein
LSGAGGGPEQGGFGGSEGNDGTVGFGGLYGGGAGGVTSNTFDSLIGKGANGALKIYWPADALLFPEVTPKPTVTNLTESNTNLEISYTPSEVRTIKVLDSYIVDVKSSETVSSSDVFSKYIDLGIYVNQSIVSIKSERSGFQGNSVLSGTLTIKTEEIDHELMIVNNDKNRIATWNDPNYQLIQKVTLENDPRRITVRLLNFIVGVTGEGVLVPTQIQVWF